MRFCGVCVVGGCWWVPWQAASAPGGPFYDPIGKPLVPIGMVPTQALPGCLSRAEQHCACGREGGREAPLCGTPSRLARTAAAPRPAAPCFAPFPTPDRELASPRSPPVRPRNIKHSTPPRSQRGLEGPAAQDSLLCIVRVTARVLECS